MDHVQTRTGLYIERFGTSFAMGLFLILPLHFKNLGWDETFFGQVYAVGALGTILSVGGSAQLIRRWSFSKVAPVGSLLYTIGCLLYCVFDHFHSINGYYLASLLQGAGWGLTFTVGPIGIASTLSEKNDTDRAYYFTVHSAYTALGAGSAPFVIRFCSTYLHWTSEHLFMLAILTSAIAYIVSAKVAINNKAYQSIRVSNISGLSEFVAVLKQPSLYFCIMIFFGSCIYTAVISLQMTFADLKQIDYIIFYGFYSLAIIASRFTLSRMLSKIAVNKSIPCLILILTLGVWFLFFADDSSICYALSASLLGAGYGLAYSLVQSEAVRYVPATLRPPVLIYFSLSYFLGVYLFPYFAALIATTLSYEALWFVLIILGLAYFSVAVYFYQIILKKLGLYS
ncbi:MAG: MFS transporter [Neisseriales bacterium]|nr:MAG: MFS transporter [Neisseriales bacterium]